MKGNRNFVSNLSLIPNTGQTHFLLDLLVPKGSLRTFVNQSIYLNQHSRLLFHDENTVFNVSSDQRLRILQEANPLDVLPSDCLVDVQTDESVVQKEESP
ncbi:hypothetical protein AVEN_11510-1 [Araneus ventricosus]|uniref:Uncharacterized protein n=1 Tax=Araneus ventricosus TaxID=182803 RepID=A0A4Y2MCD5_ARAVE|nr:hypothetical protein AVEN_11510-1 [Araneus ventricosus]